MGLPLVHAGGSLAGKDWSEASSTSSHLSFSVERYNAGLHRIFYCEMGARLSALNDILDAHCASTKGLVDCLIDTVK